MRFSWKGRWRSGELVVEAETLEELDALLDKMLGNAGMTSEPAISKFPSLATGPGCSDAVKAILKSELGNQPKTMAEIRKSLEANGLFFSKGTLSGTLRFLAKQGSIRRFKSEGKWVYAAKEK